MTHTDLIEQNNERKYPAHINVLIIVGSVMLFFLSIILMVKSMGSFSYSFANYTISATSNPFIGLFIGLLATALLQSSSTTTTIAVAAVASGNLSLAGAIPIVMGANVGTTITSTIVSMSYIAKQKEFGNAVAAGTSHDFFNILTVLILFPLEVNYRFLEKLSLNITSFIHLGNGDATSAQSSFGLTSLFSGTTSYIIDFLGPIVSLLIGAILLFTCIKFISKWLYQILIGKTKDRFENVVFKNKFRAFGWGLIITSIAQSSSLTTSLIVPLVATGKVKVKKAFQFILGANVGTTLTALLAAISQSEAAISLAIVHLLFNLIGVLIFFLVPYISQFPVLLANMMGTFTVKARLVGFAYILIAFFLIPFTLIYISKSPESKTDSAEMISGD